MGDATRIVVAQMARVWLAAVGTPAPGDPVMAMPTGWKEVGLFTPDSLGWATDPSFEEVRSHQSNYPTRRFQTEDAATAEVDLQEWSGENFKSVYGGDTVVEEVRSHQSNYPTRRFQTEDAATAEVDLQEWSGENFKSVYGGGTVVEVPAVPGATPPTILHYKFTPPPVGGRSNVAACIELIDGLKHYRRIVPVCTQNEGVAQSFEKTSESTLPLRLAVLGSDIGDPFYDLTDDEAFEPAA